MINENELNISNRSYINKDFAVIYPELLTIAKQLSNEFDPTTSNESDPFIVLLKLLAFVGDKLNYNTDKNILERFMPSATQESTMRDLTSMLGYNMNYYIAPETDVYLKYIGKEDFNESHLSFTLKALETIFTDSDGETQFVLTENCVIDGYNKTQDKGSKVIQGVRRRINVLNNDNESEIVLLENLDDNNRIYFPEKKVAQNGIFISGGTMTIGDSITGYWDKVDNLNTQSSGKYVYIFGYDSSIGYPFIQFPDDIANLIGDGLTIDYVVTDGASGNIAAKKLTTLKAPTSVTWDNSEDVVNLSHDENTPSPLYISNPNGSINGKDPEDINSAYVNFKKTIGTFDTLITCRDYANAIYNMNDIDDIFKIVSNIQVSDRRTDLNYATNIVTFSQYGLDYINTVKEDGMGGKLISAYDLILYPLAPLKIFNVESFKKSFEPMDSSDIKNITKQLDDYKCLSHNYVKPSIQDIYAIKNYYKLKAFISTTTKVTPTEGASILANINKSLIEKFYARNVDYGYEIPYDILLDTVEKADERIKSVSLYEPELETKFLTSEYDNLNNEYKEYPLFDLDSKDKFLTIVAKNVLSGRIPLFEYYDKFKFEFGQIPIEGKIDNVDSTIPILNDYVKSVTTKTGIVIPNSSDGYTLLPNEVIQIVSPSLITDVTYPYGINYYLYLDSGDCIEANTEYELKTNELCVFEFTNSNNEQVVRIYKGTDSPTILKPNFDMYTTNYRISAHGSYTLVETPLQKEIYKQTDRNEINEVVPNALESNILKMFTLTTNQQVEHRTINKVDMKSTSYCAWITNNENNQILWDNDEYMLKEGEYFFQTDLGYNELISYGSGTLLIRTGLSSDDIWKSDKVIDIEVLDDVGLLGHKEYFKKIVIDANNKLTFLEQQIITLVEGDSIKTSGSSFDISDNEFDDSNVDKILYKFEGSNEWTPLEIISYTGGYHKMRGLLDINCGPNNPQILEGNQSMIFTCYEDNSLSDEDTYTIEIAHGSNSPYVRLERPHQTYGGIDVNLMSIDINNIKSKICDTVFIYGINSEHSAVNLDDNYETLNLSSDGEDSHTYYLPNVSNKIATLMIYSNSSNVTMTPTSCSITNEKDGLPASVEEGINCFKCEIDSNESVGEIEFSVTSNGNESVNATLIIRTPKYLIGYNDEQLGLSNYCNKTGAILSSLEDDLKSKISSIDINNIFDYYYDIENSKSIEYDDLSSPYAFYDYNNVANKWTLSEIEFSNEQPDISITRGSLIK